MFRKRFAIKISAFVVSAVIGSGAYAFEETPLPPAAAPAVPQVTAPPSAPSLSLDEQNKPVEPKEEKKRGLKIPGLGKVTVPKLNFGLDLMYGNPEPGGTELGFTNDGSQNTDDLTIMGKMKRRF